MTDFTCGCVEIILSRNDEIFLSLCVHVCVCMRACVCVRACVRVCVCVLVTDEGDNCKMMMERRRKNKSGRCMVGHKTK